VDLKIKHQGHCVVFVPFGETLSQILNRSNRNLLLNKLILVTVPARMAKVWLVSAGSNPRP